MKVTFDTEIEEHRLILQIAAEGILKDCCNSYINAGTEILLRLLKNKGVYNGSTIGIVQDIMKNETCSLEEDAYVNKYTKHRDDDYINERVTEIEGMEKELNNNENE